MNTAGIICEYNPLHFGHIRHIEMTKAALGPDGAVVCVMSGNFVQRGDFAVFDKFSRAEAAASCGADLVLEMPTPYVLSSADGFAAAGIHIINAVGICDYISFGSECGDIGALSVAAEAIVSPEAETLIKEFLGMGISYADAQQRAADSVLGKCSDVFKSPNNLLGIEYLKAIKASKSKLHPLTIKRIGSAHDSESGNSASALRKKLLLGEEPWDSMPQTAADVFMKEMTEGRGPVSMDLYELAMLSRLRSIKDFSAIPGAAEGLDNRFARYASSEPTILKILENVKTKRYAMSRLRRMLINAVLGITAEDTSRPPPYIRVLAMNQKGKKLLKTANDKASLPVITKPAAVKKLPGEALRIFNKEVGSTDFYTLAYNNENERRGGLEWRQTPKIVEC